MKILIVEDNEILAKNLARYLEIKNFEVDKVLSVEQANIKMRSKSYELLILDVNLPWESGLTFCHKLRQKWDNISIIMLTSSNTSEDIVLWLEKWADDYVWKPFDYDELIARIKAVLRRKVVVKDEIENLNIWNTQINFLNHEVKKDNENINLSSLEFNLLKYFIKKRWEVISREELLERVWGEFDRLMFSRTVDIHIWYLRKKFWKDFIKTVKWAGYILD